MATTDYSTSRYQDAVTEWAYGIAGEGWAPTAGDLSEGRDWCALVTLTYDAGDPETTAAATDGVAQLFEGAAIIIREDSQGFVWTDYGPVHPAADPRAYAAVLAAWADIESADAGEDDAGDAPHVGHTLRLTGAWYCDTCDSPYCERA